MLEELAAQIGERMRIEEINYPQYPSQILEPMEFTESEGIPCLQQNSATMTRQDNT